MNRNNLVQQDKQVFNSSDARNFRIFLNGYVDIPSGSQTASVTHDLGYIPTYEAYANGGTGLPEGYNSIPYFVNDGINNLRVVANVTRTTLEFSRTFTGGNTRVYYYIFREKAV